MKKNLLFVSIIILLLTSCKNNAVNFNDELVKVHSSVQAHLTDYYAITDKEGFAESDSAILVTEKSIKFVEGKVVELGKIEVPKGGEEMMRLAKELYSLQLSQLKNYKEIFAKTTSEENKITLADKIQNLGTDIGSISDKLQESQKKFAKDNNYKVK